MADVSQVKIDATTELNQTDKVEMPPRTVQEEFFTIHFHSRCIYNQAEKLHFDTREQIKELKESIDKQTATLTASDTLSIRAIKSYEGISNKVDESISMIKELIQENAHLQNHVDQLEEVIRDQDIKLTHVCDELKNLNSDMCQEFTLTRAII
jgi:gas vesicle protein